MKKTYLSLIIALISSCIACAQNTFPTNAGTFVGVAVATGYTATHSLTLGSTATGIAAYNTTDPTTTNYQRMVQGWNGGIYQIGTYFGGSASFTPLQIGVQTSAGTLSASTGRVLSIYPNTAATTGIFDFTVNTGGTPSIMTMQGVSSGFSGMQNWLSIQPTINQSQTAGYRALFISPWIYATGSGTTYLIDAGVNSAANASGTHTSKFVVTSAGGVGINTTYIPSGYQLAINGSAIATSIIVQLKTSWPDYVFKKQYQLPSLKEVKNYIDQNHHLLEIPTEQQVAKDGLNLGEMDKLLVKKVEELTLYLLEKDKQIKNDEEKIKAQNDRIAKLEDVVNLLIKKQK